MESLGAGGRPLVEGEHDFTSFAAVDPEKRKETLAADQESFAANAGLELNNVRTIFLSQWQRHADELIYTVRGNGFLHHMVRNLVGTFLMVGKGSLTAADVRRILELRDRSAAEHALAERDLKRALELVRQLLDQGESAIGILLVAILPTIRNLLLAKDLMERHRISRPLAPFPFISAINRLPAEATQHLPRKKDGSINAYALGIAAQNAHRFATKQLTTGMQACLAANLQLVTTQLDHELILTEVVVRILGRGD